MNNKISALQCAYDYLAECCEEKSFVDIWKHVVKTLNIENPETKISAFYTKLTLDGRFVALAENYWNLRTRVKSDNYHINMNEVYSYDEAHDAQNTEENDSADESNEENIENEVY